MVQSYSFWKILSNMEMPEVIILGYSHDDKRSKRILISIANLFIYEAMKRGGIPLQKVDVNEKCRKDEMIISFSVLFRTRTEMEEYVECVEKNLKRFDS